MLLDQPAPAGRPVISDSPLEDGEDVRTLLEDLLDALSEEHVKAVIILGPELRADGGRREVLASHTRNNDKLVASAAAVLASSTDFECWDGPLVAFQQLSVSVTEGASGWRTMLLDQGLTSFVRVAMELQGNRFFEFYTFTNARIATRAEASTLAWASMGAWPRIRRAIAAKRLSLSKRELECLHYLCTGLTAAEVAMRMSITERTVTHYISCLARKFGTNGRSALPQLAAWLGKFETSVTTEK